MAGRGLGLMLLDGLLGRRRKEEARRVRLRLVTGGVVSSLVEEIPPELIAASRVLRVIEYVRGLPVNAHCKVLVFSFWAKEVGYQPTAADYLALKRGWL